MSDWSADNAVTPFWSRMPRIFGLPLDRSVLARILTLSAVALLSPLFLFLGPFFGGLLMLLALLAVFVYGARYGFTIIERSSQGFLNPSNYPMVDEDSSIAKPLKYVAVNMVFGFVIVAVVLVSGGSEFMAWTTWLLLFGIAMPAAVMRLVTTGRLMPALSPAGLAQVIGRFGKGYFVLCVFVFFADLCRTYGMIALGTAGGLGGVLLGAAGGKQAGVGFGVFALLFFLSVGFWYFTYVICALIGYAMYQYADALEITVLGPGETHGAAATRRVDVKGRTRDAMIAKLVASGDVKEAIEVLNEDLRERPQDLSLHARLHKLLLLEGYAPRLEDHTEKYLNLLMKTGNEREALPLAEEALGRSAEWSPRTVEHIVPLARAAMATGKPQLAAQLIRGFDKKHKAHPDVPHVYLIGAQLMLQAGGPALERGRDILEHLVKTFPDHPAALEGRRTLERMDKLAASPATLPR